MLGAVEVVAVIVMAFPLVLLALLIGMQRWETWVAGSRAGDEAGPAVVALPRDQVGRLADPPPGPDVPRLPAAG